MTKKNILFLVEGMTEGLSTPWGKGLWNILKVEKVWMRERKIHHDIVRFNGKSKMQGDIKFRVGQHLSLPKKTVTKAVGKPTGDYVFIVRDLDCEDRQSVEAAIDSELVGYKGSYSIHFAIQEIEAWMIADLDCFKSVYKSKYAQIVSEIKNISYSSNPEKIDCEPKKLSERLEEIAYKCQTRYKKTIEGPQLLEVVNPDSVAAKCPSFARFRQDLRAHIGFQPTIPH
ncbi:DUF4276 family protein [Candidatus Magnetobacterium casense]|uniref:DUF4276 family protein n=1 Tax=Candidatus Magnetobacterium casense TaxID=1455061 RepID=A0ABS6S0Y5_9BACT|nr:DUF4276 family protein [Candidatus Magnetobacterium casensis]MBV6342509.1 DUF4276 family protein [Candidatus Magnetobacterium casensis]